MALAKAYRTSLNPAMVISLLFSTTLLAAMGATASPTVEIPRYGDLSKTRYHILEENEGEPIHYTAYHEHINTTSPNDTNTTQATTPAANHDAENLNTWSVAWYLTLLGAFIIFFILIGLTEIFCRRRARESRWHTARRDGAQLACQAQLENVEPPPSYDLFKPPSYSTLFPPEVVKLPPKAQDGSPPQHKQLVYVVSVHGGRGVS